MPTRWSVRGYHRGQLPLAIPGRGRENGWQARDIRSLFEALCLTYFENGLSWAAVWRKRDAFRRPFHHFDPVAVAALTDREVSHLLADRPVAAHSFMQTVGIENGHFAGCFRAHPSAASPAGRRPAGTR